MAINNKRLAIRDLLKRWKPDNKGMLTTSPGKKSKPTIHISIPPELLPQNMTVDNSLIGNKYSIVLSQASLRSIDTYGLGFEVDSSPKVDPVSNKQETKE